MHGQNDRRYELSPPHTIISGEIRRDIRLKESFDSNDSGAFEDGSEHLPSRRSVHPTWAGLSVLPPRFQIFQFYLCLYFQHIHCCTVLTGYCISVFYTKIHTKRSYEFACKCPV